MHYHASIERTHGIATEVRRWLRTQHTEWHTEVSLSRHGYFCVGCDIFTGDEMLLLHTRLIWLWVSLSVSFNWKWVRALREKFYARFGKYRGREFDLRYHDAALSWNFFAREHESSSRDPWWMHRYIYMPWHPEWVFTEGLSFDQACVVWREDRKSRKTQRFLDTYDQRKAIEKANSVPLDFTYTLKNGTVQKRIATVRVERMAHGYRWLPFPFHIRTSIWMDFDGEVGERTGSWKGGTTGCGWDVLPGETAVQSFRRMERERKFN